ncbi:MAG: hypothetical protein ABI162_00290 [Luteolibacter sp.]
MTTSTSFSVFHQWLLADPADTAGACAVTIHIDPPLPGPCLIEEITDYLNEYDDDGDGRWLAATTELVEKIAADANYRVLLGIPENDPPGPDGFAKTLGALSQRGHVVFRAPDSSRHDFGTLRTFHAGVGGLSKGFKSCHLILNPDLMDRKCIARIIGDVFLEWLHCGFHHSTPIHEME